MNRMDVQLIASLLNQALGLDSAATEKLISQRVPVNDSFLQHPHFLVTPVAGQYCLGLLGVLNGVLLASGSSELVCAEYESDEVGRLVGFSTLPVQP